jgi:ribose transport system substrate-binding protein
MLKQRRRVMSRGTNARVALLTIVVIIVGIVAGCGSSDDGAETGGAGTGAGVSRAKEIVAAAKEPTTKGPDLPPVDIGGSLKGDRIVLVSGGLSYPFSQTFLGGMEEAAAALGMTVAATDAAGDPSKASALIDRAISRRASAIVLQGIDPIAVKAAIQGAKSAEIPVVGAAVASTGPMPTEIASTGIDALVDYNTVPVVKALAAYVVADAGPDTEVGLISASTFRVSPIFVNGFNDGLRELCPSCTVKTGDSPLPQWQSGLPSLTSTMIRSNPDMEYLIASTDAMVASMKPALISAGAQGKVKIASINASLPDMKAIASDDGVEVANVGVPVAWHGWATVDQVGRLLSGAEPVLDPGLPYRLFDASNIGSIDLSKPESTWYGPFDYQQFYRDLWGV